MTGRQQLFLFVLGVVSVSLCVTGVAMAYDMMRRMNSPAPVAAQEGYYLVTATPEMAWNPEPPTWTPPPPPSPTHTLVPTWTPVTTETPTPTVAPTDTLTPAPPLVVNTQPPPPTATPVEPAATQAPNYPFNAAPVSFDTGTPNLTYITGMVWKVIDINTNHFDAEPGYKMRVVDPSGQEHWSDESGLGGADSRCLGCGDNRRMNMKVEFGPYTPGTYHVSLFQPWDEQQGSNEIEITLSADPQQYVHIDFFPN